VRVKPHIRHTPALDLPAGAFDLPHRLALKLESLQHSGSFKGRGAFHKLLASTPGPAGVIAASGGNHGAAVAYAARSLGHRAEIFVPTIAAAAKVERLKSYGATVHQVGAVYAEARAASEARAQETGALTVGAYDDPEVFVGAGTTALEFEMQAPFDTLLVAVGGGGLIGGIAAWCGGRPRVIGVEPAAAPTLTRALAAGKPVDAEAGGLAADSLAPQRVGELMFPIAQAHVAQVVLVSDAAIARSQRALWETLRLVAEPGGAAAFSALLDGVYRPAPGERVGVLVSGSNTTAVRFDA
jgi:threonine dehydratase